MAHAHDHGPGDAAPSDGSGHFDTQAATWDDDPAKVRRSREIAEAIAATVPLSPATRVLEYGAGTGLVSQALTDRVGPLTLVDRSAGMRAVLAEKVVDGRLPAGARVWDLDLEQQDAPEGTEVDLVVASMVLHHVAALDRVLAGLVGLLVDGGHLAIADLDQEDGSFHASSHAGEVHHGFDRRQIRTALERAGAEVLGFTDCEPVVKEGREYAVFLVTARRR